VRRGRGGARYSPYDRRCLRELTCLGGRSAPRKPLTARRCPEYNVEAKYHRYSACPSTAHDHGYRDKGVEVFRAGHMQLWRLYCKD
jgi:hypothetical protein